MESLLIYSDNDAILYPDDQQFMMTRKTGDEQVSIPYDARSNFIAGFTTGFLLKLDFPHCLALGLIIFGADCLFDQQVLLEYIEKCREELNGNNSVPV